MVLRKTQSLAAGRHKKKKPIPVWETTCGPIKAWTRSEVRAMLKKKLGIEGRLPSGIVLVKGKP
jgi:hypothetical protein